MSKPRTTVFENEAYIGKTLLKKNNVPRTHVKTMAETGLFDKVVSLLRSTDIDRDSLGAGTDKRSVFNALKRMKDVHCKIVFIVNHYGQLLEAVKTSSPGERLIKQIKKDTLVEDVLQAERFILNTLQLHGPDFSEQKRPVSVDKLLIKTSGICHMVKKKDIIRCEADVNYTRIHLKSAKPITSARTLKQYENVLNDLPFLRVHQSHLINIDYLLRYEKRYGGTLILEGEKELPVSKKYKDTLLDTLGLFDAIGTNNK
ncbi:LytTR family transcriptional regulator [Fulvivirga sp. M361]|uniref:LytR/AlgR family response regulator transcription factor n=1 Tax=Fulvivirga sp. M361 TaxID=2594266 RepID=UPI00117A6EA8|nr:LytTR family DNA-binding domain-containing protein [Fulvivirga sp. M361]TRX51861.1 LytTR family transcriptional regulator [Fulvivirga sp. M361]